MAGDGVTLYVARPGLQLHFMKAMLDTFTRLEHYDLYTLANNRCMALVHQVEPQASMPPLGDATDADEPAPEVGGVRGRGACRPWGGLVLAAM